MSERKEEGDEEDDYSKTKQHLSRKEKGRQSVIRVIVLLHTTVASCRKKRGRTGLQL